MNDLKKFNELIQNENFLEELLSIESMSEAKKYFEENGIEISDEELIQFKDDILKISNSIESLNEDELKNIAGGNYDFVPNYDPNLTCPNSYQILTYPNVDGDDDYDPNTAPSSPTFDDGVMVSHPNPKKGKGLAIGLGISGGIVALGGIITGITKAVRHKKRVEKFISNK